MSSAGSGSVDFVISVNSVFEVATKIVLAIESVPIDIVASSMPSV